MKKKATAVLLAASMCLAACLCGCNFGGAGDGNGSGTGDGNTDITTPETPDYAFSVCDIYSWVGYPAAEFTPVFADKAQAEELTYEYDETLISLSGNTVTALKEGVAKVKVKSSHYETSFNVHCQEVDKTDPCFSLVRSSNNDGIHIWLDCRNQPSAFQFEWDVLGREDKTTLFIGDSYMDRAFFSKFDDFYGDKDALCWGIGSTDSFTWETLLPLIFTDESPKNPKNLVMHVGTNDVYNNDVNDTELMSTRITSSLQRIFTLMHKRLPDTQIYWFTITDRVYEGADARYPTVHTINENMLKWGEGKDWITIVDTNPKVRFWMMRSDGTHVKAEEYGVFTDALEEAGIDILDK